MHPSSGIFAGRRSAHLASASQVAGSDAPCVAVDLARTTNVVVVACTTPAPGVVSAKTPSAMQASPNFRPLGNPSLPPKRGI